VTPPTTALADVLALLGEPGFVRDPWLGPVAVPTGVVAGRAVTIRLSARPGSLVPVYGVLSGDLDGAVLVVTGARGVPGAVFGQILARAAATRGAVGALVDGFVRDRGDLAGEGLAVWGGPPCAVGPSGMADVDAVSVEVEVGGTAIAPGDTVVLDADGVVVLRADRAAEVMALAATYADGEAGVLDELAAGRPLTEAYRHKKAAVERITSGGTSAPTRGGP
jgi:4-hydroxy-4-methyl-2-oxoglutarate aldolase